MTKPEKGGGKMEFLKKLFGREKRKPAEREAFRGLGPMQSQEEQDTTRKHMEEEMTGQRERREADSHTEPPPKVEETEPPKDAGA